MPRPGHLDRGNPLILWYGLVVLLGCIAIALILPVGQVAAQSMTCAPYQTMEDTLTGSKHSEAKVGNGLSGKFKTILFVNPISGKFSIVVRRPDGIGCLVGAGTDWKFQYIPSKVESGRFYEH